MDTVDVKFMVSIALGSQNVIESCCPSEEISIAAGRKVGSLQLPPETVRGQQN